MNYLLLSFISTLINISMINKPRLTALTLYWLPVWSWWGLQKDFPTVGPLRSCRLLRPQHQDSLSFRGCSWHVHTYGTYWKALEASNLTGEKKRKEKKSCCRERHHHLQTVPLISCMPSGWRVLQKMAFKLKNPRRRGRSGPTGATTWRRFLPNNLRFKLVQILLL